MTKKTGLWVAVVVKNWVTKEFKLGGDSYASDRSTNDWAAFIDRSRDGAIRKAMAARSSWNPAIYTVLVGKLTEQARDVSQFELVKL